MSAAESSRPAPRRRLYVVATVHLDTQWRWTVRDTIRDFLPATLDRNFDLLRRYPFFVVSFEGAFRYMLMKEYYPRRFRELQSWVAAGRWRLAGGMLDAPDVNIVAPESLIRHVLYGNGFFQRQFGRCSRDLFLPDCFGFGHALPSVAAHCGLLGFSSQKFGRWMTPATIPFEVGVWQGPDGAEILAALRPEGYGEGLGEDLSQAERYLERIDAIGERSGAYVAMKYVGVGDRGGGLDERSLEWLQRSVDGRGPIRVVVEGSDQLFVDLAPEQVCKLPRHRGELLLPTHGTGCLTSQSRLKRRNRRSELLADACERAAAIADWLGALPYPVARLREAWIRFLWHQMHDDLTGTSIPAAYRYTRHDQLLSLNQFAAILRSSVGAVAAHLDTRCQGEPIVVFNPLSMPRQDLVEVRLPGAGTAPAALRVVDPEGREVPAQGSVDRSGQPRVLFLATLPPLGFAVFDLQLQSEPSGTATGLEVDPSRLESPRYRVQLDDQGDIRQIVDKITGRELLGAPVRLELLADRSSRWPAWEIRFEDLQAEADRLVAGPAAVSVCEQGPVRVAVEILRRARGSRYRQVLSLAAGAAGDRVEVFNEVRWRTRGRLLKVRIRTATPSPRAVFDLGLGVIERGISRRESYEVPAQQWAALAGAEGEGGISILNDCKYGWDRPDERTLRLSLLRSPRVIRRFRHQGRQDFGGHRFTYALYGHGDDWEAADSCWQAARLNQPLLAFRTRRHPGELGRRFGFAGVSSRRVAVKAMKKAEGGEGLVMRLQELSGRAAAGVEVEVASGVERALRVDGVEGPLGEATVERGRLRLDAEPFAVRAYSLGLAEPGLRAVVPRSRPLQLPLDVVATRRQDRPDRRGFDGAGHSIPAELFPARLELGGVEFVLQAERPESASALACRGQTLELVDPKLDQLHLLAAAVAAPRLGLFQFPGGSRELLVASYTGLPDSAGSFRRRRSRGAAGQNPTAGSDQEVAWIGTHRHGPRGEDEPYVFCCLFRYRLALPPGCDSLTLPDDPQIRIFAATQVDDPGAATEWAQPLYD